MGHRTTASKWWLARLLLILAVLAPAFLATPAQAAITFPIKINFQSAGAAVPAGYLRDFGEGFGLRSGTAQGGGNYSYGWVVPGTATPLDLSASGGNGRDRNVNTSDQRLDTLVHMQANDITNFNGVRAEGAWEIELPNGIYNVTVAVGDPIVNTPVERHYLRVEGKTAISNFQPTGAAGDSARHKITAAQVTVNDGRLTVDALIPEAYNTKINFIEIVQSDGTPPRPTVFAVTPANSATGVRRDANVSATLTLPNGGLDSTTVVSTTVYLVETTSSKVVPANVNTSGGGDVLVLSPLTFLEPNTQYTFFATDGVRDVAGRPLVPFSSSFTTGTAGGPGSNASGIVFQQVPDVASGVLFSSVEMGPDSKLYVATLTGFILRYSINPDGTVGSPETIATVRNNEGGDRAIIGLAFDPAATASNLILWVSHNGPYVPKDAPDWTGKIARLSGPNLETFQNYVVNLPHSYKDHMANSLEFGPDGKLYISVGSNSGTGEADTAWGGRPERLLSGSILRVDQAAITTPPLDVKTEEGGSYNPFAANAPVTLFASGVRNAYDLVWHSNGQLYSATNGSARGGNTPGTPGTLPASCRNRIDDGANGDYTGPVVPARTSLPDQRDFLFRVVQGKYYGHPNPLRCEWVLTGGNPSAGVDPFEVPEYPVGTAPDRNFGGISYDFDAHKSPNGMIEYKSDVFNGALKGRLLVVRFSENDDIIVLNPGSPSKDISEELSGLPGLTGFTQPLDLAEDTRNGNVYVVEHGPPSSLTLLRPLVGNVAAISLDRSQLVFTDTAGGPASAAQTITIRNQGTAEMTISGATIAGANASEFAISSPPPNTIASQGSGTMQISFNPTSVGPKLAVLRITSNAVNAPTIEVTLRGLAVAGQGGANEPSLQWILDTYEYKVNVGDPNPADNALPATALLGDEVALQRFERADNANPVIVEPLAVFGPTGTNPVVRFGWYNSGAPAAKTQILQVSNTPALNGQRLNPPVEGGAALSFDPGLASFGFYSIWPFFANREVFSEDALNTWEPTAANRHKVRVYPLKDSTGARVENAYVVATEEDSSGYDYQDVVVIVRNVRPFGSGPEPVPAPPANLVASARDRQISLTWTPGSGAPAASYAIYRSTTPSVSTVGTPLGTSASASYTDTGLTNGTTYYYAVVALNSAGQASGPSNTAGATPFAPSGTIQIFNPDRVPYNDRLVFYDIANTARRNHNRIDLQVRNLSTTQALRVSPPAISGPNPTAFSLADGAAGFNIPPGETRFIRINLVDDRTQDERLPPPGGDDVLAVERYAFLNINSSDPAQPNIVVELAGIIQAGEGGDREPTLQQIFNVFGYGTVARYNLQGLNQFQITAQSQTRRSGTFAAFGDEVLSTNGLWARANVNEPIYVRHLVATHSQPLPEGRQWDARFRITGNGCVAVPDPDNAPDRPDDICTFWNNGTDWHEFLPPIYIAATSPSSNLPAEMTVTQTNPTFQIVAGGFSTNRHTSNPPQAHAVRMYIARDRQGNIIPNTYLVSQDIGDFGLAAANWDYQDNIYLVTNIRPATIANDTTAAGLTPGAEQLVLEFDRAYPGTLADKDGEPTGFSETQRNEEVPTTGSALPDVHRPDLPPSTSYDPTKLDLSTAGQGTLAITASNGSAANSTDNMVNGLCLPFNAKTAKFVMQTRLLGPLGPATSVNQAGLMFGPNTYEYVKLMVDSSSSGRLALQFIAELNNVLPPAAVASVALPASNTITSLDLRLTGDPAAGTVEAAYSINGAAFQTITSKVTLSGTARGRFFDRNGNGCIAAFHRGSTSTPFTATFDRFAITPAPELLAPRTLIARINTGGGAVTVEGQTWQSDATLFTPGESPNEFPQPPAAIANTTLDRVYQDYRGQVPNAPAPNQRFLTYNIPVGSNNKVAVRLHFAELYWGVDGRQGPGQRIFDVYAEGKLVLDDFDIFRAAGGARTAIVVPIENVDVADGSLTLTFHSIVDNTSIAGIEVFQQPNDAPVADAGLDQKVEPGVTVSLVGNATDSNPPQTYRWRQVSGTPAVALSGGGNGQTVTFQAPASSATLEFELTVTNALGLTGTDRVIVQVGDIPIAGLTASNDGPKEVGNIFTLSASVTAGDDVTYSWNFGDGNSGTGASVTHAYATPGTYTATVTATNGAGSATATTVVTVNPKAPFELRINAGGPEVTLGGKLWVADLNTSSPRYSVNGSTSAPAGAATADILNTELDTLYRDWRVNANLAYTIPVPVVDDYIVTLHFAEIYHGVGRPGGPGKRVFSANLEGGEIELPNFDIIAATGGSLRATTRSFTVRVSDDRNINLTFASQVDNAALSAIEVVRVVNNAPIVNAGPDQTVQPGATVALSGSVSDPEGTAVTFTWSQVSGTAVTLSGANTLTPSFVAPAKGSYVFRLTGRDADGVEASDTVTIVAANQAPTVTASASPAAAEVGDTVALTATASDADGDPLTYAWVLTNGPAGGALGNASSANASFVPAAKGSYTFTVTVGDGEANTPATVTITVANQVPTVTASASPAAAEVGDTVTLAAAASDADGDPLTYSWQQTDGPAGGALGNASSASASFVPAAKGSYTFTVTVSDGVGGSATATATFTVANRAPTANAGADQTVGVGASVALNGSASSDPDGDELTYRWTKTTGPAVTLSGADTATPSFTAPGAPATFVFELVVTDDEGLASIADTVTVTVEEIAISGLNAGSNSPTVLGQPTSFNASVLAGSNVSYSWSFGDGNSGTGASPQHTYAAAGTYKAEVTATNSAGSASAEVLVTVTNTPPTANAGANQTVLVGAGVTLDGSASSDADGHTPLSYSWQQAGGPTVALTGESTATPSFTAPASPTALAFELTVTDARGAVSAVDRVLVTVVDSEPQSVTASNNGPTALGQATTLTATASGTNLTYSWNFGDGGTGSGATVSHTYAAEGSYVATVTVRNGTAAVGTASTGVEVTNAAPTVNAGADRGVDISAAVTLSGTAGDPDGHTPLAYSWKQLSGPVVALSGANTATASFTAPALPATLIFELTVTDARGKSASDSVRVVVGDQPIAGLQATSSSPTVLGQPTSFSANVSSGSNVVYTWDFGGGNRATGANVQFTFAAEGSFPVTVTATNAIGSASRTLAAVVTNAAPTLSMMEGQEVKPNDRVTLSGTASDPDAHTPLAYRWEQVSGQAVTLAGATSATASFTAPNVEGVLVFKLTVTDSRGKSASGTVNIDVRKSLAAPNLIFLPILGKGDGGTVNTPADLVVSAFTVTPADLKAGVPVDLKVTVTNRGTAATGPFWVDLYINPNTPPTAAGVTWDTTCTLDPCHGVAWLVEGGLAGGASVTLTLDPSSYYAANTRWFGSFAAGTNALYVYVDSWNLSNPAGAVAEADETNNRRQIVVPGTAAQLRSAGAPRPQLPQRFIPGL